MLAYYVEWHMREASRELMFADEDLERKNIAIQLPLRAIRGGTRESRPPQTQRCLTRAQLRTLLGDLSTIVRNSCEGRVGSNNGSTFQMTPLPNPAQQRAMHLLQAITCSHSLGGVKCFNFLIYREIPLPSIKNSRLENS
jgi:hypothetical protein